MLAALKVPKAFFGFEKDLTGKATLAAEDIRFARTVERIQRIVLSELYKIALVHLYTQGFDGESLSNFDLHLTVPSIIYEQEKIMLWKSLPIIRNNGYFELFYYTHWLHILYYVIMIIHSDEFWIWFIIPFVFVLIERLYSIYKLKSKKYGLTLIKQVNLLASNVTNLVITRPKNFKFKSGDYIFINIPSITRTEWHPFTISSAPEQSYHLTLHIRSLGNWTNNLYAFFYVLARMDPLKQTKAEPEFNFTNSGI
jgi:hypothetical protein